MIEVQQSTPEDILEIVNTLNDGLAYKLKKGDEAWGEGQFTLEEVGKSVEAGERFNIELDGQLVGVCVLQAEDTLWGQIDKDLEGRQALYLHSFALGADFRGTGIGEQVMSAIARHAQDRGADVLRLDYPASNDGLAAYYASLGFTKVAEVPRKDSGTFTDLCELNL